ncbi:MAG TPA: DUF1330 domain-containing protein [Caulobacteraceae bacterium]|jgi:uncharacterized protein (DUF1330 family)|nr:DUF1330 domain-containing protein [Caulobacteraceae bacterium]
MAAYLIGEFEVTDPALHEDYRRDVPAVIAAHGGRYLVRGGAAELVEGEGEPQRLVILEFPNLAAARAFFDGDAYAPLRALRQRASRGRIVIVDGVD